MTVLTEAIAIDYINHRPEVGLGFGIVARAAQLLLIQNLNDEIDHQQDRYLSADLAFQTIVGGGPGQTVLEHVAAANIYAGPHKSLLIAPPSYFPNVSVTAYRVTPRAAQSDDVDDLDIRLAVEVMVKAGPITNLNAVDQETTLHRRIERTIEAADNVIRRDPTLIGTCVPGQDRPPIGAIGNQTDINQKSSSEPLHYWQGGRLEYTIQRQVALP